MAPTSDSLMDDVGPVLREVSVEVIEPRFEALRDGDVRYFVAGPPEAAVMVAPVRQGTTWASWIWQPVAGAVYQAERGAGATRNGRPVVRGRPSTAVADLRGSVLTRFLDEATRERVDRNRHRFAAINPGTSSADRLPVVGRWRAGLRDVLANLALGPRSGCPAGRRVRRSGAEARWKGVRTESDLRGLLAAASPAAWQEVRDGLLGDPDVDGGPDGRGQGAPVS